MKKTVILAIIAILFCLTNMVKAQELKANVDGLKSAIPVDWYKQANGFVSDNGKFEFLIGHGTSPNIDSAFAIALRNVEKKKNYYPPKDKQLSDDYHPAESRIIGNQDGSYGVHVLMAKKVQANNDGINDGFKKRPEFKTSASK